MSGATRRERRTPRRSKAHDVIEPLGRACALRHGIVAADGAARECAQCGAIGCTRLIRFIRFICYAVSFCFAGHADEDDGG